MNERRQEEGGQARVTDRRGEKITVRLTRAHGRGESDYSSLWAGRGGELSERMKEKDHE